jgi:hypothetical protein
MQRKVRYRTCNGEPAPIQAISSALELKVLIIIIIM